MFNTNAFLLSRSSILRSFTNPGPKLEWNRDNMFHPGTSGRLQCDACLLVHSMPSDDNLGSLGCVVHLHMEELQQLPLFIESSVLYPFSRCSPHPTLANYQVQIFRVWQVAMRGGKSLQMAHPPPPPPCINRSTIESNTLSTIIATLTNSGNWCSCSLSFVSVQWETVSVLHSYMRIRIQNIWSLSSN